MTYSVDLKTKINLAPKTLEEEVMQNLAVILNTMKFSVPLDRNFGISARFSDKPSPAAKALIISEVFEVLQKYEPRAEVSDVSFETDEANGKIVPKVKVRIVGG